MFFVMHDSAVETLHLSTWAIWINVDFSSNDVTHWLSCKIKKRGVKKKHMHPTYIDKN